MYQINFWLTRYEVESKEDTTVIRYSRLEQFHCCEWSQQSSFSSRGIFWLETFCKTSPHPLLGVVFGKVTVKSRFPTGKISFSRSKSRLHCLVSLKSTVWPDLAKFRHFATTSLNKLPIDADRYRCFTHTHINFCFRCFTTTRCYNCWQLLFLLFPSLSHTNLT